MRSTEINHERLLRVHAGCVTFLDCWSPWCAPPKSTMSGSCEFTQAS